MMLVYSTSEAARKIYDFFDLFKPSQPGLEISHEAPTLTQLYTLFKTHIEEPQLEATLQPPLLDKHVLLDTVKTFIKTTAKQQKKSNAWINNGDENLHGFFWVQKKAIPVGSKIALWGDIHGSAASLLRDLYDLSLQGYINDNFKIMHENFYLVFHGDYVDRGKFGSEVLYTVMRLKIANPESVVLIRGNHEEVSMNSLYGFDKELTMRYELSYKEKEQLFECYYFMPSALFINVGTNSMLCTHGALELGYDPKPLLNNQTAEFDRIKKLDRETLHQSLSLSAEQEKNYAAQLPSFEKKDVVLEPYKKPSVHIGFSWHDLLVHENDFENPADYIGYRHGRGIMYGKNFIDAYLTWASTAGQTFRLITRGHQHNSTIYPEIWQSKGFFPHWHGTVFCLLSAPACHLKFDYDSYILVTTAQHYEDWYAEHRYQDRNNPTGFISQRTKIKELLSA